MSRKRQTLTDIFTVARDPSLSPGAKGLWLVYRSYDGRDKGAHPGDELVASHLDCSPRTVQRWRAELIESGHLRQQLDGPKTARYFAVLPDSDDTGGEALPEEDTTQVAKQGPKRDDTSGDAFGDDTTEASPSGTPSPSPHSTLSTLSTSDTPSLRSEVSAGRDRPARGVSLEKETATDKPNRCAECGGLKAAPRLSLCTACRQRGAGLREVAFRGRAPRTRPPDPQRTHTPAEKGLAAVCPTCGGGMSADAERCGTCRSVPAELGLT